MLPVGCRGIFQCHGNILHQSSVCWVAFMLLYRAYAESGFSFFSGESIGLKVKLAIVSVFILFMTSFTFYLPRNVIVAEKQRSGFK